jgi:hypothetical protein
MFRAEFAEIVLLAASPSAHQDSVLRTTLGPGEAFTGLLLHQAAFSVDHRADDPQRNAGALARLSA